MRQHLDIGWIEAQCINSISVYTEIISYKIQPRCSEKAADRSLNPWEWHITISPTSWNFHTPAFLPVSPFVAQHPGRLHHLKRFQNNKEAAALSRGRLLDVIASGSACSLHCPYGCGVCKKKAPLTGLLAAPAYQWLHPLWKWQWGASAPFWNQQGSGMGFAESYFILPKNERLVRDWDLCTDIMLSSWGVLIKRWGSCGTYKQA